MIIILLTGLRCSIMILQSSYVYDCSNHLVLFSLFTRPYFTTFFSAPDLRRNILTSCHPRAWPDLLPSLEQNRVSFEPMLAFVIYSNPKVSLKLLSKACRFSTRRWQFPVHFLPSIYIQLLISSINKSKNSLKKYPPHRVFSIKSDTPDLIIPCPPGTV